MRYNFALRIIIPALPEAESQAAEHFEERGGACPVGVRRNAELPLPLRQLADGS
jgi:hypothetical protein